MIDGLDETDYLAWNYDFLRVHRVMPRVGVRNRASFKLKDLRFSNLNNNPGFAQEIMANNMVQLYDSLWIEIKSPKTLLKSPGEKTMGNLAAHCHKTAKVKHAVGLADE